MTKVLILIDWFDPAYKAGGPIRSCVNMVKSLEQYFEIYILTSDTDLDDKLHGLEKKDEWLPYSVSAKVMYLSAAARRWRDIAKTIREVHPDTMILNSMFSKVFTIYPLLLNKMQKTNGRILIFPRGMLKRSALGHKSAKKKLFFLLAKPLYTASKNIFVVTDKTEDEEVKTMFSGAQTRIAANFSDNTERPLQLTPKTAGFLKMIFVGRVHPIKNLKFLLELLTKSRIRGSLKIIGVLEDENYWRECDALIDTLEQVQVDYLGEVPHEQLYNHITDSHLFVLPTLGENFGHAIAESLSAGRPVLISDRTPWRSLHENNLGWEYPLAEEKMFQASLEAACDWTGEEFDRICKACYQWYTDRKNDAELIEQYKNILEDASTGD